MGAVARLGKLEAGALGDDLFAEQDEGGEQLLLVHLARLAVVERQHVDPEARL